MEEAKKLEQTEVGQKGGRRSRSTRRKRPVRARTIPIKKMTREQIRIGRLLYPETDLNRPQTRAACVSAERPCPHVSCKYHLYLDVNPETGSIMSRIIKGSEGIYLMTKPIASMKSFQKPPPRLSSPPFRSVTTPRAVLSGSTHRNPPIRLARYVHRVHPISISNTTRMVS